MSGLTCRQTLHNLFFGTSLSTEMVFVLTFSQYPVLKVPAAVDRALGPPHRAARRYNARPRPPAGRGWASPYIPHIRRGMKKGGPKAPPRRRLASPAPPTGQRRPALPRADPAVPSALGGLASGFGMGPGVPRPPWPLTGGGRCKRSHLGVTRVPWGPHSDARRIRERADRAATPIR